MDFVDFIGLPLRYEEKRHIMRWYVYETAFTRINRLLLERLFPFHEDRRHLILSMMDELEFVELVGF